MSALTDIDFAAVRDFLAAQAGLVFDEGRRAGLSAVVADRLMDSGAPDVPAYLASLAGSAGQAERQRLLDAVTVQETHFFRNPPQVEALRRRVLPDLLRRAAGRDRPLTIWSAGCSTGEEPYTLAMLLLELAPVVGARAPVRIVATDVSAEALRAADRATYAGRTLDRVPAVLRDRWFEPRPGGAYAVTDQVRALVDFRLHNLVTDPVPFTAGQVDLVVCRNVTIYFGRETTRLLMGSFHDVLSDGGYLFLGHSETLWQVSSAFSLLPIGEAFVYRRAPDAGKGPAGPPAVPVRQLRPRTPRTPPVARPPSVPPDATDAPNAPNAPAAPAVKDATGLLAEARSRLTAGDYPGAVATAQAASLADPLLAPAYVVQGSALTTLGLDGDAVDSLRKAVYLDPGEGHAHFLLAGALARMGQHASASVSYRAAERAILAMPPEQAAALLAGRDAAELVDLCRRLADQSARLADDAVASVSGGDR
jgi:chemotaxis protein methyltransferase CheR